MTGEASGGASVTNAPERADRKLAEQSIRRLYKLAGLAAPLIVWTPCPRSGLRIAILLALCDHYNRAYVLKSYTDWITGASPLWCWPPRLNAVTVNKDEGRGYFAARWRFIYDFYEVLRAIDARCSMTVSFEVHRTVQEEVRRGLSPIAAALTPVYRALREAELAREWSTWWDLSSVGLSALLLSLFNPVAGWLSYSAAQLALTCGWFACPLGGITPRELLFHCTRAGMPDPLGARPDLAAYLDYMLAVLGLPIYDSLINLNKSAGWCWPLRHVCVVAERPTVIHRDSRGRLHSEDGPAIAYQSGWGLYCWHGVAVRELVIKRPERISLEMIDKEPNTEVRRVMINRYKDGPQSYLQDSGARLVHEDRYGKLWRKDRKRDTPLEMVEVLNSTPEADGSRKAYWLRVKPGFASAQAAVAWTFGVNSKDYAPVLET